jgi:hypothetical protein
VVVNGRNAKVLTIARPDPIVAVMATVQASPGDRASKLREVTWTSHSDRLSNANILVQSFNRFI